MDTSSNCPSVLEDKVEAKLLVEQRKDALSHLTAVQTQIYKLKLQYNQMKSTIIKHQFKYFIYTGLDYIENEVGDDEPIIDNVPTKKEVKALKQTVSELKEKLDISKSEKEDSCDALEIACDEFKSNLQILQELTKDYESKKQKLADALEVSTSSLEEDFGDDSNEIQEKVKNMKELNKEVIMRLDEVELNLLALRNAVTDGTEVTENISREVQYLRGSDRLSEWCGSMLTVLAGVSGLQDRGLSNGTWHVAIQGPCLSHAPSQSGDSHLELNIKMKLRWEENKIHLESVDLDNPDLAADDMIKQAVADNDIRYLLVQLQDLWLRNYPMIDEIDHLRQKYAIDWEQESLTLTVMYGKTASIMCVLKVSPDYPGSGTVTLEKVKSDESHDLENLKLEKDDGTLMEWLEHLQKTLDPRGIKELDSPDH